MTEDDLLRGVVDLARVAGYRVCHFRPARTARGWRTAIMGDPGWPDVAIAGHGRLILAELKAEGEKPTPDQEAWLAALREAGIEAYVWRPKDWTSGHVRRILERHLHEKDQAPDDARRLCGRGGDPAVPD